MNNLEKEFRAYVTLLSVISEIEERKMVTQIEIQAGLAAFNRISDLLKKAKEISDKTQNIEFKEILTEIRSELVETKNLLIDSKEEINNLKSENQKLKEEMKDSKIKPCYIQGFYYTTSDGEGGTGPYCTGCYDKNRDLIRLAMDLTVGILNCPICDKKYPRGFHNPYLSEDKSYEEVIEEEKRKREERKGKRLS